MERSGRTEAYVPGSELAPAYIGDFPHRPNACSAILDWAEETATAADHAASLILKERTRLTTRIARIERKIDTLNRAAAKREIFWDRRQIVIEVVRLQEDVKLAGRMLLALA